MEAPSILQGYRRDVELEVSHYVPADAPGLYEVVRYQLGWTDGGLPSLGKCLRPALCLFTCEALGGDRETAMPAAVAIELIHNFSLVHDDIEDGDEMRHHRPTAWRVFGRDRALLAGFVLWSLAYRALHAGVEGGMGPELTLAVRRIISQACNEMIEGQHLDLTYEQRTDVTLSEYTEMISRKTAALFQAALQTGALIAGVHGEELERFGAFGRHLGLAFQIRDDILGIWGEGIATGKPVGADIAKRKKSLPVVHAFQQVVGPDRDVLRNAYAKATIDESDIDEVLDVLQRWNCRYFAQGLAEDHRSRAMAALSQTNIPASARYNFDQLTAFILERDH